MFNVKPVYRTPAGWVKQLDSGEILGPVESEALARALSKEVEETKPLDAEAEVPTKGKKAQSSASAGK